MILKLRSSLLLIFLSILFYSCEKEYSLEGNVIGGTAVFTLSGSPSSCTNAVVTGNYEPGVPLDPTNLVTIAVEVTNPGTYSVSTPTVNGISFSGSGTFSVNGTQTITLTGSGIPAAGGSFSYSTGTTGCSFPVTVSGGGSATAVFTYGGAPGICTNAVPAGTYTSGVATTASNTVTLEVNVTARGAWSVSTPAENGISFAGTGNFASEGPQTITLSASGTPALDGVFEFVPSNNGCSFYIIVETSTPAADFLRCTINGVPRLFNFNIGGTSIDPALFELYGSESSAPTTASFDIGLSKTPTITTGDYPRASATNLSTFSVISYNDGVSPTGWGTPLGAQTGAFTVTVTSFTADRIEGTFSGTLYDQDGLGTGTMEIKDGSFSVPY